MRTHIEYIHTGSVEDCNISIDVRLRSADVVPISRISEFFSEGFPIANSIVADEVVQLQENADVLQILLMFMHNTHLPELNNLEFSTISSLAEAAEKYMIHSAMALCRIHME